VKDPGLVQILSARNDRAPAMEGAKQFITENFERFLVAVILAAALGGTYLIPEPAVVLNFFYLPALVASYFLGRRTGILAALFSILSVIFFCGILFPERFFPGRSPLLVIAQLSSWGGFLILASAAVGTLYELNERKLQDLRKAYVGILEILSKYLESTDRYTKGHSVRVAELAMETAIALDLHRSEVENIRVAGLLHDIGKIEVSGEVLRKAAELNDEEREIINEHAAKGARLLASVGNVLKEVVPIVLAHHKNFMSHPEPGGGPQANMPLGARVVAVADAFDAMTSDRPYRKGMPPWQAMEEIVKNAGKQFDGEVVEAFKRVMEKRLEKT
jgi:putative nucleotidyltransferase with HDIG domain